jgi:phosphohistidine phosphatase
MWVESRQNRRMTSAKQLIVMRHAKTESHASSDHARVLTDRGERDSEAAGRWLAEQGLTPQVVLVSSAARARGTVDRLVAGLEFGPAPDVVVLDELYGADEYDVLALVAQHVPAGTGIAMVVGHNPTMAMTSWLVQPDEERVDTYFPTSGLAVFEVDVAWDEVDPGVGTFVRSHTPKD